MTSSIGASAKSWARVRISRSRVATLTRMVVVAARHAIGLQIGLHFVYAVPCSDGFGQLVGTGMPGTAYAKTTSTEERTASRDLDRLVDLASRTSGAAGAIGAACPLSGGYSGLPGIPRARSRAPCWPGRRQICAGTPPQVLVD